MEVVTLSSVASSIRNAIGANTGKTLEQVSIERKLDKLFRVPKHDAEVRKGLHASAIIVSDSAFCLREQVLSLFFVRNAEDNFSTGLLRIFEEGNYVHAKWQDMFVRAGVAIGIEDRSYSKLFDLYMTPDAVIEINNKSYVVEIKSANTFSYKKMTTSHPSGTKQLQLYMHFLCIPRGFVLVEDKNNQEFKVFPVHYEPGQAAPFVRRLYDVSEARERYINDNILPKRECPSEGCSRASRCSLSEACWNKNRKKL